MEIEIKQIALVVVFSCVISFLIGLYFNMVTGEACEVQTIEDKAQLELSRWSSGFVEGYANGYVQGIENTKRTCEANAMNLPRLNNTEIGLLCYNTGVYNG